MSGDWTPVAKNNSDGWAPVKGAIDPSSTFLGSVKKTVSDLGTAMVESPGSIVPGVAEAVVGGTAEMGTTAAAGLVGLAHAAFGGNFQESMKQAHDSMDFINKLAEPETQVGKEALGLISKIPQGFHAAGEKVFEKTGSPLAAASTEAILTALSFYGILRDKGTPQAKQEATTALDSFGELAKQDPAKAADVVAKAPEELKKELDAKIKEATVSKQDLEKAWTAVKATAKEEKKQTAAHAKGMVTDADVQSMFDASKMQEGVQPSDAPIEDKASADVQSTMSAAHDVVKNTETKLGQKMKSQAGMINFFEEGDLPINKDTFQRWRQALGEDGAKDAAKEIGIPPETIEKWNKPIIVPKGQRGMIDPFLRINIDDIKKLRGTLRGAKETLDIFNAKNPEGTTLRMPTDLLWSIKDVNRVETQKGEGYLQNVQQDIQKNGIQKPVVVTISTKDRAAYLTDGNNRVAAANNLGISDVPVKLEKTDVPFTPEQLAKSRPLNELGISADMVIKKPKTAQQQADFEELQALLRKEMYGGMSTDDIRKLFSFAFKQPVFQVVEKNVTEATDQLIRNISPETLGDRARSAAAVVASAISKQMREDSVSYNEGKVRTAFWDKLGAENGLKFIIASEKGAKLADPNLEAARLGYKQGYEKIFEYDQSKGINYEARDNYITHIFEDDPKLEQYLNNRYGPKWNNPKFMKERGYEMYMQAIEDGFKPKYTNPEDIFQARLHASHIAGMRVDMLRDLAETGLARIVKKGDKIALGESEWRAPNGERYFVDDQVGQILHNAFNTKSLWNLKGLPGIAFRGLVSLKNTIVPPMLAFSLFHPLHVLTIDNVTEMSRATHGLLKGETSLDKWTATMANAARFKGAIDNPKNGLRLVNVWKGLVPADQLNDYDRLSLQYMEEGGFIPEQSSQYRLNGAAKFKRALDQRSMAAAVHAPFAIIDTLQAPIFKKWIPALKASSYLRDVEQALKENPNLYNDRLQRMKVFRQIQKSVDNRYGEMSYNTLFWNKWVKDLGVMSTLSMGWELGFLREYGGALVETGRIATEKLGLRGAESIPRDRMNKALFVGFYTAQALGLGGLMTYAMTGTPPQGIFDYTNPRVGGNNPDGTPKRVSTMFYTREFVALGKEAQTEGVISALAHYTANKAAPSLSLVKGLVTNLDYFGHEISDPNAGMLERLGQRLDFVLQSGRPIPLQRSESMNTKDLLLSFAGFNPAPKYVYETPTQTLIKTTFHRYHGTATPFERAEYGQDSRLLREAYNSGNIDAYETQLEKMRAKYDLSNKQLSSIRQSARIDPHVKMFKSLTTSQQVMILKQMPSEELQYYLPQASDKTKRAYARATQ